jgi:ribosomal protein S2
LIQSINKQLFKGIKPMLLNMFKKKQTQFVFIGHAYDTFNKIEQLATKNKHLYANPQWLEGFLTNKETLMHILEYYPNVHRKYFNNVRLKAFIIALKTLSKLPEMGFIINTNEQIHIIHELTLLQIPLILVYDLYRFTPQNVDLRRTSYPIFSSQKSIIPAQLFVKLTSSIIKNQNLKKTKNKS